MPTKAPSIAPLLRATNHKKSEAKSDALKFGMAGFVQFVRVLSNSPGVEGRTLAPNWDLKLTALRMLTLYLPTWLCRMFSLEQDGFLT